MLGIRHESGPKHVGQYFVRRLAGGAGLRCRNEGIKNAVMPEIEALEAHLLISMGHG